MTQQIQNGLTELLWDYLKRDPEHEDRRRIGGGTKTQKGLALSIERVFHEGEDAQEKEALADTSVYGQTEAKVLEAMRQLRIALKSNIDEPDFEPSLRKAQLAINELLAQLDALGDPIPEPDQGSTCPKCGGHSFRLRATFDGDVCITFNPTAEDPTDFEVDDSNPTDSEWDGPATCRDCGWDGQLTDLLPAPEAELVEEEEEDIEDK